METAIDDILNVLLPLDSVQDIGYEKDKLIEKREKLRWALRALVNVAADKGRGQIQ